MKVAPLCRAIKAYNELNGTEIIPFLVHTGQHYDFNMSDVFFRDLQLPEPDIHLGVGSASHGEQTGRVLIEFEKVLLQESPDLLIVVGDVNSTLACALAAVKLDIPVAHVEAGLRSFDRKMPEEINRLLTDAISNYLFTPSPDGDENLLKEGIPRERIFLVGDIMVDSLLFNLQKARQTMILEKLSLRDRVSGTLIPYSVLTLHRPSNVDNRGTFERIVQGLLRVSSRTPVLCAMHPRTKKQVKLFGIENDFHFYDSPEISPSDYFEDGRLKRKIHCIEPLPYLDFLNLMANARIVLTDSGGIQEETTVLDIPCITLRDTTERPITLTEGTNVLVHEDPDKIEAEAGRVLEGKIRHAKPIPIWDGRTAERIIRILADKR